MNIRPYIIAALAALSVSPAITAQKKGTDFTEHLDQKVITEGNAVTRRHETIFFNTVKDALSKVSGISVTTIPCRICLLIRTKLH